LGWGVTA